MPAAIGDPFRPGSIAQFGPAVVTSSLALGPRFLTKPPDWQRSDQKTDRRAPHERYSLAGGKPQRRRERGGASTPLLHTYEMPRHCNR
jgi:hypothetical protein